MIMKKGFWVVKIAVFGVFAVTLVTWGTMLLWNWLVPVLFSGPVISFWQTLGLLILSKILFSGFGKGGRHQGGQWRSHYWKRKWSGMTPEERESFRGKMKEKWCDTSAKETGTSNV
jgi:hypothetical protein